MTYTRLKPSPFIITKYSQPFELVLFHVINADIK